MLRSLKWKARCLTCKACCWLGTSLPYCLLLPGHTCSAVDWSAGGGGGWSGEIVNEILLSRAAWRRSRCRGAGVTTLFLLQPHCPAVEQCSGGIGGKSLGWIPHISTHYGHFVDTDPDSRLGVRVLVFNCSFHLIFLHFAQNFFETSVCSPFLPLPCRFLPSVLFPSESMYLPFSPSWPTSSMPRLENEGKGGICQSCHPPTARSNLRQRRSSVQRKIQHGMKWQAHKTKYKSRPNQI